jgi:ATP-binding cassette, subfamily B, bacterial PglK
MYKSKFKIFDTTVFFQLFKLLVDGTRNQSIIIFLMIFFMAILDVVGVASILPFIAVLSNPDIIYSNDYLNGIYFWYNFENETEFLIFLGSIVLVFLLVSLVFKSLTIYLQVRFALMKEYLIGENLFKLYLNQNYTWFLDKNNANLSKQILSEVTAVVHGGILQIVNAISQGTIVIMMLTMLFYVNITISILIIVILVLTYTFMYNISKAYLNKIGQRKLISNEDRFTTVTDGFNSIIETKLYSLESYFINKFGIAAKNYALNLSNAHAINIMPRYILEGISFGSLMVIILYGLTSGKNILNFLPQISFFALASVKLMPAINQVYSALSSIRFHTASILDLSAKIENKNIPREIKNNDYFPNKIKKISLKDINYSYPKSNIPALKNINLEIKTGNKFAIIGKTGSGKSTLAHLLLGIVSSDSGTIKIDDVKLNKDNNSNYRDLIGYVPQNIFMMNDSVVANIAFGVEPKHIDFKLIKKVLKISNLEEYIKKSPNGLNTIIGDKGIKLSGGERQRIGIARALYRNPNILILDEATSSLDVITENKVMAAISNLLNSDMTIIIIAHRLSTVKACSDILLLDSGEIIDSGDYKALEKRHDIFTFGNK